MGRFILSSLFAGLIDSGGKELDRDRALDPFLEELAAVFVYTLNISRSMVGVGCASAGAVELCPAVSAFRPAVGVAGGELVSCIGSCDAGIDISHLVLGIADELMARIEITPRSDRKIFST